MLKRIQHILSMALVLLGCLTASAQVSLVPGQEEYAVSEGDEFAVVIQAQSTNDWAINGAELHIAFDTSAFEVLNIIDEVGWQVELLYSLGNETGEIEFAGGNLIPATGPAAPFDVVTIELRARQTAPCTTFDLLPSCAVSSPEDLSGVLDTAFDFTVNVGAVIDTTICVNEPVVVGGTPFSAVGEYTVELFATGGCDSIVELTIPQVFDTTSAEIQYEGCAGDGYTVAVGGDTYDESNPTGMTVLEGSNAVGCDSFVEVQLTFFSPDTTSIVVDTCTQSGFSLEVGDTVFDEENPVGEVLMENQFGCDSLVQVQINYAPLITEIVTIEACAGSGFTYQVGSDIYDESNPTGTTLLAGVVGCDTIVTVEIVFLPPSEAQIATQHCQGDGYNLQVGNDLYDEINPTGQTLLEGANQYGCDSTVNVDLEFLPSTEVLIEESHCVSENFTLSVGEDEYSINDPEGQTILEGQNQFGCDSVVNVDLEFLFETTGQFETTFCSGSGEFVIIGNGLFNEQNPSGTAVIYQGNQFGCDSIVQVELQFEQPALSEIVDEFCEGDDANYQVGDDIYDIDNPNGSTIFENATSGGCDSIVSVDLTFHPVSSELISRSYCENDSASVTVGEDVYNMNNPEGITVLPGADVNGCDSIVEVMLSFDTVVSITIRESYCAGSGDSLVVGDELFNESNPIGTITSPAQGPDLCDTVFDVELQFAQPSVGSVTIEFCSESGDTLLVGDEVYNEENPNGATTLPGEGVNGCDSIVEVQLLYHPQTQGEFFEEMCAGEGESRLIGFTIYDENNTSGVSLLPGANRFGCDSVVNVELVFNETSDTAIIANHCQGDEYTLQVGGDTYDENSPTGTTILSNANRYGCDSVVHVELIFNPSSVDSIVETHDKESGYSIVIGGRVFDESNPAGEVVLSGANVYGCDSTVVVELNFVPPVSSDFIDRFEAKCYPNPTAGAVRINSTQNIDQIKLYSAQGAVIDIEYESSPYGIQFDLGDKPAGCYWIECYSGSEKLIVPVIKID